MKRTLRDLSRMGDFSGESDLKERLASRLRYAEKGISELSVEQLEGISAGTGQDTPGEVGLCYKKNTSCGECIFGTSGHCRLGFKKR